jgi:hypothetical protein
MKTGQETTACHEATEADTEKIPPNPRMMLAIEEHQEIPKGEATVIQIGESRKRRRDRNLVAERRQKWKERTRGYRRSRSKLAGACRKVSHRAKVAWR